MNILKKLLCSTFISLCSLNNNYEARYNKHDLEAVTEISYIDFIKQSSDKKYDNSNIYLNKKKVFDLITSNVKVYNVAEYKILDFMNPLTGKKIESKNENRLSIGSGCILSIKKELMYVLTNKHCVSTDVHKVEGNIFFPKIMIRQNMKSGIEINNKKYEGFVVLENPVIDYAILEIPYHNIMKKFTPVQKIGNSTELQYGDFLYVVGYPLNIGQCIQSTYYKGTIDDKNYKDIFLLNDQLSPGNSGGGVYALRDGTPELIGISRLNIGNVMGGVIKINVINQDLNNYPSLKKLMFK